MKSILFIVTVLILFNACKTKKQEPKIPNLHTVVVQETIQAGEYTYIKVTEDEKEKWLAAPATQPVIGKTYYYIGGMEMNNFKSKELSRTFESVYFIEFLNAEPPVKKEAPVSATPVKPVIEKKNVTVAPIKGSITIADLFKNKNNYTGKSIKIKAKVTKFNSGIMNRNWIHIQDGTEDNGNYDLTITSTNIVTEVGKEITIEGKVAVDKDFGAGYKYVVIIEDAVLVK